MVINFNGPFGGTGAIRRWRLIAASFLVHYWTADSSPLCWKHTHSYRAGNTSVLFKLHPAVPGISCQSYVVNQILQSCLEYFKHESLNGAIAGLIVSVRVHYYRRRILCCGVSRLGTYCWQVGTWAWVATNSANVDDLSHFWSYYWTRACTLSIIVPGSCSPWSHTCSTV